jgi:hypothetical protein
MSKILSMVIIALLIASNSWAVVVTGSGTTKEDAINNGLREAIEMYTGALVYGVTDVENYQVRKDQIVTTSLGHVKNYQIIKTSKLDDLILITLDVTLSEDNIKGILRDNVKLVTYEDVLRDYNNVSQRQEQIKKLAEMFIMLSNRPVSEKYNITYEGYEIKQIKANSVNVVLSYRISENPFYNKTYNELLKNLSERELTRDSLSVAGNYLLKNGKLINESYYIADIISTPLLEDIPIQVLANGVKTGKCRLYRDNLLVVYDIPSFAFHFILGFPKAFMQEWNKDEDQDEKTEQKESFKVNAAITKSTIIPPGGLPMTLKYVISDTNDVKSLKDLKLTLEQCVNPNHKHFRNMYLK